MLISTVVGITSCFSAFLKSSSTLFGATDNTSVGFSVGISLLISAATALESRFKGLAGAGVADLSLAAAGVVCAKAAGAAPKFAAHKVITANNDVDTEFIVVPFRFS